MWPADEWPGTILAARLQDGAVDSNMDIIEKLRGQGRVLDGGDVLADGVPYQLTLWRDSGRLGIDGRLAVSFTSALRFMDGAYSLAIEAEDGRRFRFRMTSTTGRISGTEETTAASA